MPPLPFNRMSRSGVFKYSSFAFVLTWLLFKFSKQTNLGCHSYVKFWLTSGEDLDTVCACQKFRVCAFCRCARDCKRSPENDYFRDLTTTQVKGIQAKTLARVNAFDPVFRWTIRPCFIFITITDCLFPHNNYFCRSYRCLYSSADPNDVLHLEVQLFPNILLAVFVLVCAGLVFVHTRARHTTPHRTHIQKQTRHAPGVLECLRCGSKSSMSLT